MKGRSPRPGPAVRGSPRGAVGTYPLGLLVGEDACGPSSCEVAVNFERVLGAALVRIYPVFTWTWRVRGGVRLSPASSKKQPHHFSSAAKPRRPARCQHGPSRGLCGALLFLRTRGQTPPQEHGCTWVRGAPRAGGCKRRMPPSLACSAPPFLWEKCSHSQRETADQCHFILRGVNTVRAGAVCGLDAGEVDQRIPRYL